MSIYMCDSCGLHKSAHRHDKVPQGWARKRLTINKNTTWGHYCPDCTSRVRARIKGHGEWTEEEILNATPCPYCDCIKKAHELDQHVQKVHSDLKR